MSSAVGSSTFSSMISPPIPGNSLLWKAAGCIPYVGSLVVILIQTQLNSEIQASHEIGQRTIELLEVKNQYHRIEIIQAIFMAALFLTGRAIYAFGGPAWDKFWAGLNVGYIHGSWQAIEVNNDIIQLIREANPGERVYFRCI